MRTRPAAERVDSGCPGRGQASASPGETGRRLRRERSLGTSGPPTPGWERGRPRQRRSPSSPVLCPRRRAASGAVTDLRAGRAHLRRWGAALAAPTCSRAPLVRRWAPATPSARMWGARRGARCRGAARGRPGARVSPAPRASPAPPARTANGGGPGPLPAVPRAPRPGAAPRSREGGERPRCKVLGAEGAFARGAPAGRRVRCR